MSDPLPDAHMHSVDDFISSLCLRNVELRVQEDRLSVRAARGVLHQNDFEKIHRLKHEIIELLRRNELMRAPLRPRTPGRTVPLPPMLYRSWRATVSRGGRSMRSCAVVMRVSGPVVPPLLQSSLDALMQRHEALRTRFIAVDGIPRQQIDPASACLFDVVELLGRSSEEGNVEVLQLVKEFVGHAIDLSTGPLFAARLWRLTGSEQVLVLAINHMITDGFSNEIINQDLWTLYEQASKGLPFPASRSSLQFADYAVWHEQTGSAWFNKHGNYWKQKFSAAPRTQVPCDYDHVETENPVNLWHTIAFGRELRHNLSEIARRERTLLSLVVLTIHIAAMSRWCNQEDLVVLVIDSGRCRPELEHMVGFLATTLFLRVKVQKSGNLIDLLKQVVSEFQSAQEHNDLGRVPDFLPQCSTEVTFNWVRTPRPIILQNIGVRPMFLTGSLPVPQPAKFGCDYYAEDPPGLAAVVRYRPDLLAKGAIEQFAEHLLSLAKEIVSLPAK